MKVWWVLSGDNYYPAADNFFASFETREEANNFVEELKSKEDYRDPWYMVINISDRI